jgi:hypothetical protein
LPQLRMMVVYSSLFLLVLLMEIWLRKLHSP